MANLLSTILSGNNHITLGPNSTWSSYLRVGGNGHSVSGNEYASVVTTNGNLHLDAGTSRATYINYYAGTAGIAFGNGASGIAAWMGSDGDLWKGGSDNSGTQYVYNSGTWGISITGNANTATSAGSATSAVTADSSPLLSALGDYVFTASTNGRDFSRGIQTSFVSASQEYPEYGSVVRIRTYTGANDGGTAELYFPYSSQYGGTSMRYRLGQYSNAGWTGWKTVIDSDNIGAQSVSNATTAGGLAVHTGRNNEANKIVRTQENGYVFFGYNNSSSGNENNNSNPDRVWGTNGSDDYLRTYRTSALSVGYAASAGSASTASVAEFQSIPDYRGNAYPPNAYTGQRVWWHFNNTDTVGGYGTFWHAIQTVSPWTSYDSSHRQQQIQWGGTDISFRYATSGTTWSSWFRFITDANIASQSVNYAASAGNANTLDSLDSSDFARGRAAYQVMSLDDIKQPGLYQYDGGIGGTQPEGADQANLRTIEIGSGSRYSQMAFDWASDQAWFRRQTGDVWSTWREFIHSGNIGSQSVNYANSAGAASTVTHFSARTDSEWYNVIWGAGSPSHMYSSDSVRIRSSDGALRANIYYDNQDTSYYLDPNGSSVLNGTVVIKGNDNQLAIDGTTGALASGLFFRESGVNKYELYHYSGEFRFYNYTTNQQELSINNAGGFVTARTSFRAPIFYDSDDTGFYVDPNGTSNLRKFSEFTMAYNGMNPRSANSPYVDRYNGSAGYRNGTMGFANTDFNVIARNWGSGFIDTWSSPANAPGGSSHYIGLQGVHYSDGGTPFYGFQMACAGEADNRFFWRSSWPNMRSWVEMIHSGNIASQSVSYADESGYSASSGSVEWTSVQNKPSFLSTSNDSEQEIGLRYASWNDGARRMNTDPRWNESGYDADLGCLHIWAWTAAGVAYGRAGIALYNGGAYQYLTTRSGATGLFVNNNEIIHAGNIGSQSVNYASSAGNSATTSQIVFNDLKTNFPSVA
jgi:hypothetical protein